MHRFKLYRKLSDARGEFHGIINYGSWQEVNIVHTKAHQFRGGHFHRHTTEVIFMLNGSVEVSLKDTNDLHHGLQLTLLAGEGIQIPPNVAHDFLYCEDSTHLQLLDHKFDPANQDMIPFTSKN